MIRPDPRLLPLLGLALPAIWVVRAWPRTISPPSPDLFGHFWFIWNAAEGRAWHTDLVLYPDGVDLVPTLGTWFVPVAGGLLAEVLPLGGVYNLLALLLLVGCFFGGRQLSLELGASPVAAVVGGLVLQLDGFVLHQLSYGRMELVGMGFGAYALALAIGAWRRESWGAAIGAGLAGAFAALIAWHVALLTGLVLLTLVPFLWRDRAPGAHWRWLAAAGVAMVLVGPLAIFFLSRAVEVRTQADELPQMLRFASRWGVGVFTWLSLGMPRPAWIALLAAVALPWTLPREHRRLGIGLGVVCFLAFLLALGPNPRLVGGFGSPQPWAPFTWVSHLSVMRWFIWPDRYLAVLGFLAAPAAALLVDAAARRWGRRVSAAIGGVLLLGTIAEHAVANRLPVIGFAVEPTPWLVALRDRPDSGAVIDLPRLGDANLGYAYQIDQIVHRRPILFGMPMQAEVARRADARFAASPPLAWADQMAQPGPMQEGHFTRADFEPLVAQGYRYVVLHQRGVQRANWERARRAFDEALGPPVLVGEDHRWLAYDMALQ